MIEASALPALTRPNAKLLYFAISTSTTCYKRDIHKMASVDLQAVHDFLVTVAHKAGETIRSATPAVTGHGTKKNSADLVTETDQAVEKMVSEMLKREYPDFE
jgi:fructose-1,6-bisphosphatase/inositol monophosphatase family enzyme